MRSRVPLAAAAVWVALVPACEPPGEVPGAAPAGSKAAELAACDESDLEISYGGPMYHSDGRQLQPFPRPYVVAATGGWAKKDAHLQDEINTRLADNIAAVLRSEGLLAAQFAASPRCGSSRTLSFWRDQASLLKFVNSEVHLTAVSAVYRLTDAWETTHWVEKQEGQGLTFQQSMRRLAAEHGR